MTLSITLQRAREEGACKEGLAPVVRHLGSGWGLDVPFPLLVVLEHGRGLDDALWALRCTLPEQNDEKRRVVSRFLAQVLERVEDKMADERSRAIIPLLWEHATTPVSRERWLAAARAAWAAAAAEWAARAAAWAAARAAAWAEWAARAAWEAAKAEEAEEAAGGEMKAKAVEWQVACLRFHLLGEGECYEAR